MSDESKNERAAEIENAVKEADAAKARKDAEAGQKLDKLLTALDGLAKRMDAMEAASAKKVADDDMPAAGDPVQVAADSNTRYAREHADANLRAALQARADAVASLFGEEAPRSMQGETPLDYRVRLLRGFQRHSPLFRDANLALLGADSAALDGVEKQIFADATAASMHPPGLPNGALRAVTKLDSVTGQRVTTWHGDHTFVSELKAPSRRVARFFDRPGEWREQFRSA